MKIKLLKRLRKEAEKLIYPVRLEIPDMGFGRHVFSISGWKCLSLHTAMNVMNVYRRRYILRRVAELKRKRI